MGKNRAKKKIYKQKTFEKRKRKYGKRECYWQWRNWIKHASIRESLSSTHKSEDTHTHTLTHTERERELDSLAHIHTNA